MKTKHRLLIIALIFTVISATPGIARNRWNIYGGVNLSHVIEGYFSGLNPSYRWGPGAFIGTGYEIRFSSQFSVTPALELSYIDNGAIAVYEGINYTHIQNRWMSTYNLTIPVIASCRLPISKKVGIRVGAGPYAQEALFGKHYNEQKDNTKETLSGNAFDRFNVGIIGEAALETGKHVSYIFRAQYPFAIDGAAWTRNTSTLSLGIKYSF